MSKKLNIVVAGATGYVGLDLIHILSKHKSVKLVNLCAQKNQGKKIRFFDKRIIKKNLPRVTNLSNVDWNKIDLLFLSLPNGEAQKLISKIFFRYKKIKFIDLSADFRIENSKEYKHWYKIDHNAKKLINKSLYSIPEFTKKIIKKYRIIANPGCYPTSIQLPLIPIIKKKLIKDNIITIDSKSGYSGAGKNFAKKFRYKNKFNSTYAYSVNQHRHMGEIQQELKKITKSKINFTFNPHIIPTFRGILSSIYLDTKKGISAKKILDVIKLFHLKNKFVKVLKLNSSIGTGNVLNNNTCEISVCETDFNNRVVIFSAIDNLVKGAAGQAIQNMNLLYNFKENCSLK